MSCRRCWSKNLIKNLEKNLGAGESGELFFRHRSVQLQAVDSFYKMFLDVLFFFLVFLNNFKKKLKDLDIKVINTGLKTMTGGRIKKLFLIGGLSKMMREFLIRKQLKSELLKQQLRSYWIEEVGEVLLHI